MRCFGRRLHSRSCLNLSQMAHDGSKKTGLTTESDTVSPPDSPADITYENISSFDFPILNDDGSLPDLIVTHPRRGERTPPAALSSLAFKMADGTANNAVDDLNDGQYDMVDDVSVVSDSNDTVSIASTDILTSDEDRAFTPDPSESVIEPHEATEKAERYDHRLDDELSRLKQDYHQNLRQVRETEVALQKQYEAVKETALDSFLSEDLETPRQSTIRSFSKPATATAVGEDGAQGEASSKLSGKDGDAPDVQPQKPVKLFGTSLFSAFKQVYIRLCLFILLSVIVRHLCGPSLQLAYPVAGELLFRRVKLGNALVEFTNSSSVNATKMFNLEHLLPVPTLLPTKTMFGKQEVGTLDVHFQGTHPNHIIISLPRKALDDAPQLISTYVHKDTQAVNFNQTELIHGVYAITVDPRHAHGLVTVSMPCTKPAMNVIVTHDFGHRYFQRQTYGNARTDISETVNKDLAIARHRVRNLTDRLQSEINATLAATHSIASQISQQASQEAQTLADNAVSVFNGWYATSEATAKAIRKDYTAVQERLKQAETQVDEYVAEVAKRAKRSVMEPIAVAQLRAAKIRAKYFGGDDAMREKVCKPDALHANAPSATRKKRDTKKPHNKRFGKSGELVEKTTCGTCDHSKKFLGPRSKKTLGKNKAG